MGNHSKSITVSVVMTTYNGERFVREQIDSILKNLDEQDELIVGDDGSTDNTLEIVEGYLQKDKRVKLVKNNHLGTTQNLQELLGMVQGEIVFISDQDDVWCEHKVNKICADFENPQIDLVFHNSAVSGAQIDDILHPSLFDYLPTSNKFYRNLVYFHFWGCMFALRKKTLEYILPFRFGFDSWIMFCVTFWGKCFLEREVLMTYRRHGNNLSTFKRRNIFTVLLSRIRRVVVFLLFLPSLCIKFRKSERYKREN